MSGANLAGRIRAAALRLNYEKCGLIKLAEMDEYADKIRQRLDRFPDGRPVLEPVARAADPRRRFPWAKTVLICARRYDVYNLPEPLQGRISRYYLFDARYNPAARDYQDALAFEEFLRDQGLRLAGGERGELALSGNRWAAMKAGLGLVRRNNFFYTENGSWLFLESWLIDQELELKETVTAKPCPPNCDKCRQACPTAALPEPYVFNLTACISYLTRRGGWDLTSDQRAPALGQWLYGCDLCQEACPFNRRRPWPGGRDYPGAAELARLVRPEIIAGLDYETLRREMFSRFRSIPEDRLWKWKINALNALNNYFKPEYLPIIRAVAASDPSPEVRAMAEWVEKQRPGRAGS